MYLYMYLAHVWLTQAPENISLGILECLALLQRHTFGQLILCGRARTGCTAVFRGVGFLGSYAQDEPGTCHL
jgi:hypothetical protein